MSSKPSWVVSAVLIALTGTARADTIIGVAASVDSYVVQNSDLQSLGPGVGLRAGVGTEKLQGMLDVDWIRPLIRGQCDVCQQVWHARVFASARTAWCIGPRTTMTAKLGVGVDVEHVASDYTSDMESRIGPAARAAVGVWFDVSDAGGSRFGIELSPTFEHHSESYAPDDNTFDITLSFVIELGV